MQVQGLGPRSDLIITPREHRYYTAYKCTANNRHGTATHVMELREAREPDVIPQARAIVVTATSMIFEIVSPHTEAGLPIRAFSVQYKDQAEPDWNVAFNRSWSPDSKYTIEGLRPMTFYTLRFASRNQVGMSRWGAYINQATPRRSAPETPTILHNAVLNADNKDEIPIVVSPYSDHFELSWTIPPDNGEPINFYQIKYCPVSQLVMTLPENFHLKISYFNFNPFCCVHLSTRRVLKSTELGMKSANYAILRHRQSPTPICG